MKRSALPLLTLALFLVTFALAQSRPSARTSAPTSYKLVALTAKGTSRYTDKEILAASGLELGQNAADGDFKEAARRLGESGLFTEVVYSFSASDNNVKLDLQLTDVDKAKLVPAKFENFVWFSDAELLAAIQRYVPLFKQLLPVTGRLSDQVSEALQALLNEKHLPGRVDFLREGRDDGGPLTAFDYRVEEVSIRIRNMEFPGAPPDQTAFLTKAARRLSDAEYLRSALATAAQYDFLPLYLQRGYLKARFGQSEARIVSQPPAPSNDHAQDEHGQGDRAQNELEVDAIIPVTPGKQYSVAGVDWKGNSAVTTQEASKLFHLATGQPSDAIALAHDVESLGKLYHSRGYMTAQIKPDAQLDDDKGTVHYSMNISEGDLYRMGELEILGLDTQSRDRCMEAWKLREGASYNADYTRKFLDDAVRLLPKGAQYSTNISEVLDAKDKTVDVTIHFKMQ